jgi:hypothetical protein
MLAGNIPFGKPKAEKLELIIGNFSKAKPV